MRQQRIRHVAEAQSVEKANELLTDGWKLYRVFSHPQSGYTMIFVKHESF